MGVSIPRGVHPKVPARTALQERRYGSVRRQLEEFFRRPARQKESELEEGHLMPDDVHMRIAIAPKYAVAQVAGHLKGKTAIHLARRMVLPRGAIAVRDSSLTVNPQGYQVRGTVGEGASSFEIDPPHVCSWRSPAPFVPAGPRRAQPLGRACVPIKRN